MDKLVQNDLRMRQITYSLTKSFQG